LNACAASDTADALAFACSTASARPGHHNRPLRPHDYRLVPPHLGRLPTMCPPHLPARERPRNMPRHRSPPSRASVRRYKRRAKSARPNGWTLCAARSATLQARTGCAQRGCGEPQRSELRYLTRPLRDLRRAPLDPVFEEGPKENVRFDPHVPKLPTTARLPPARPLADAEHAMRRVPQSGQAAGGFCGR
jgi:hypothetical protein